MSKNLEFMELGHNLKLCDEKQRAYLAAQRLNLFDSPYRPKHPLVEHWPAPAGERLFGMPLLRLVKRHL
jgi:hypothetical protein